MSGWEYNKNTYDTSSIPNSRRLRQEATTPEKVLWARLRGRQIQDCKFRRQQPIGPFIADFFCAEADLVIELDGDSHTDKEDYDQKRQAFLEGRGLTVLRFTNTDIRENLQGVIQTIYDFIGTRLGLDIGG